MDDGTEHALAGNGHAEGVCPRLVVGPIRSDQVLAMAKLTRDYNPFHVFATKLPGEPAGAMILHPLWISGLAGEVVQRAAPGGRVTEMKLARLASAYTGDTLTVSVSRKKPASHSAEMLLRITISNQHGELLGSAEARVIP